MPIDQAASSDDKVSEQGMCAQARDADQFPPMSIEGTLSGTFEQPVVTLRNTTNRPITVDLDPTSALSTQDDEVGPTLTVRLVPALPRRLPARGAVRSRVVLTVGACRRPPADISLDNYPTNLLLRLNSGAPDGAALIDIKAPVAAAVQRACSPRGD